MKRTAGIRAAVLGRGHFHFGDQRQVQRGAEEPRGTSQVSVGNEIIAMGNRKLLGNNQTRQDLLIEGQKIVLETPETIKKLT